MARYSCILLYPFYAASDEKQALQALLRPVIFGEKLAQRMREAHVITHPALLTQAKGDYEKLCSNLEQITLGLKYERDCWKDQCFLNNLNN